MPTTPLVLLAALLFAAPSKGPTPTPAKVSQAKQEQARGAQDQTTTDNKVAKDSPSAVKQPNPEIAVRYEQYFSDQNKNAAPSSNSSAWVVAACTIGLLILAFCQWRAMDRQAKLMHVQSRLMVKQLAEMKSGGEDTA